MFGRSSKIFIRPKEKDFEARDYFSTIDLNKQHKSWRLLASPDQDDPATVLVAIHGFYVNMRVNQWKRFYLPVLADRRRDLSLLYVFQGKLKVNAQISIKRKIVLWYNGKSVTSITIGKTTGRIVFNGPMKNSFSMTWNVQWKFS